MIFLSILLLCCNNDFVRGSDETLFGYVCRVKQLELDEVQTAACQRYIQNPSEPFEPYLVALQEIFREQLKARMGSAEMSRDFLDKKVAKLMRIFLKDKLGLHKEIQPACDLAGRAKWDPHYHAGALFADYFPKAKFYLPNYEEAYVYMRNEKHMLEDRMPQIYQAMEEDSFVKTTEAGCGYDNWNITYAGKQIVPILCHKREAGAVRRQDVLGYDVCGLENEDLFCSQKEFFESVRGDPVVRVHMGETIVPARGRENVRLLLDEAERYYSSSKPLRIGHGTHTSIEGMIRIAEKGYFIEACLSSNKRTGILDKRSDYPLGVMLLLGVKVVLGTDGGALYSTTLAKEYAYAARNLSKFLTKLQHSEALVQLPNGDRLLYQHILPLVREEQREAVSAKANHPISYKELGACLDPAILARISPETLVENAIILLERCYPNLIEGSSK